MTLNVKDGTAALVSTATAFVNSEHVQKSALDPKTIATPISAFTTTVVTAATNLSPVVVDLESLRTQHNGLFNIEVLVTTGSPSPGTSRTITLKFAYSQSLFSPVSDCTIKAATRAYPMVCNIPNVAAISAYEFSALSLLNNLVANTQGGKYMYFWLDHSALDASAVLTITVRLVAL